MLLSRLAFVFFLSWLIFPLFICVNSAGIRSVVDDEPVKSNGLRTDPMCSACEMAVVWMQNQLAQNKTQDLILDYVNQVSLVTFGEVRSTLLWWHSA